jgi:hypothetical protein
LTAAIILMGIRFKDFSRRLIGRREPPISLGFVMRRSSGMFLVHDVTGGKKSPPSECQDKRNSMFKKIVMFMVAVMFLAAAAVELRAQDVIMGSAETINKGNLKIGVYPTVLFGKNGNNSIWGGAGRLGFGLADRFDIEAKAGFFKGLNYFGVEAEYWLVQGRSINASVALGGHMTNRRGSADSSGIDTRLLLSTTPVANLEFYGGFKMAFDQYKNMNAGYTTAHLVPGIEYRLSADLDFLAEVGIALNNNSSSYASVGLSLYLLR